MAPSLVGTELHSTGTASHSGFVDLIDRVEGVRGWALNLADPSDPVLLHLCVGSQVVAETLATAERADISAKLGRPARAGFQFDAGVMLTLPDFLHDPDDTLVVRVAVTGHHLSSAERLPTAGEILAALQAHHVATARDAPQDLGALTDQLQGQARALARQALRPSPEQLQGYIETLAVDASGQVWFMGWMRRGHVQEFSAVLQERRKHEAAVLVTSYTRDDLPQGACGVVGLIVSPWRPTSASGELLLFFGPNGRFHLRSHDPLRILPASELIAEYEGVRERCLGDGRATALQRRLVATENWLPSRNAAQWHGTDTSIDRVLVVPGLGCLVEGWVLSPMRRIEGLRLRVGAAVMTALPEHMYWKPRTDLLSNHPGSEHMAARAGFVGLFAGAADMDDVADPVLKLVFEGGSSVNWAVSARSFRRLGHSASVEDALQFFPALRDEAFFPAFARAAIRAERGIMPPPVTISVAPSRRVMLFVLPDDRCDMFLLFEELARRCRTAGARAASGDPWAFEAVAFVASARSNRSDALWLFREFRAIHGDPGGIACSLLVIDDAAQAFALLPDILHVLGATRFLFVGPSVFLTEAGWARSAQALAPGATNLVFFGLEADAHERREPGEDITARCFAWSSGHLARWARTAPAFMGGFYGDNTLGGAREGHAGGSAHTVHPDAARCTREPAFSRIVEAVNASVYAQATAAPDTSALRAMAGAA